MERFRQHDGPTILVAIAIYAAWFGLIRYNALLPWWLIVPIGAYLIAWHFSLQHEAIHSFRGVPAWLRFLIVFPPLGLWFPFALYRNSHSIHHRAPSPNTAPRPAPPSHRIGGIEHGVRD
jgi:fatty acid desaturase